MIGEMLTYTFMQRALIVGVLIALCSALLGVTLVLKRYSMIGDGLSHVAFGSMAIAMALNASPLMISMNKELFLFDGAKIIWIGFFYRE